MMAVDGDMAPVKTKPVFESKGYLWCNLTVKMWRTVNSRQEEETQTERLFKRSIDSRSYDHFKCWHFVVSLYTFRSTCCGLGGCIIIKGKDLCLGNRVLETWVTSVMPWHLSWGFMQGIIRNNFPSSVTCVKEKKNPACRNSKVRRVPTSVSSPLGLRICSYLRTTPRENHSLWPLH